jgi:pimeloyl-ACP methyl ester carboxylesterase
MAGLTAAGVSPAAAEATAAPHGTDFSRLIEVNGHKVFLQCRGQGSPTIVLISGAGTTASTWNYVGNPEDTKNPPQPSRSAVAPQLARTTRVCAYDRPGTTGFNDVPSRSAPVKQPTTAQGDAAVLHILLRKANVAGPYVLVAHSWGGMIATTYARRYRNQVAGMVLIDPGSQYLKTVLPPHVWTAWMQAIRAFGKQHPALEQPDYPNSIRFLGTLPPPRRVPAVVLTSDRPIDFLGIGDAPAFHPHWVKAQALLAKSLGARQITNTHSGHFIQTENPRLVIQQAKHVLAQVRNK